MATRAIPPQRDTFSPDPLLAQKLGFISVSLSGSRASQFLQQEYSASYDWDFIGVLERKCDIISVLLYRREELWDLLEIAEPERFPWEILENTVEGSNGRYDERFWEVVRFSGWARDGSKRSIKLWSKEHITTLSNLPRACQFGVLSAKATRKIRSHHPCNGNQVFFFQPLRISTNLFILVDVDFLAGNDNPNAVGLGVTCVLFLSSKTIFENSPGRIRSLKQELMSKWCHFADETDGGCLIPRLHGYQKFDTEKLHNLLPELTLAPMCMSIDESRSLSPSSSSSFATSPDTSHSSNSSINIGWDSGEKEKENIAVDFLPMEREVIFKYQDKNSSSPVLPNSVLVPQEDFEFRLVSEKYYPSCFTSNSQGSFGEIRILSGKQISKLGTSEWKPVFAKKGLYIDDEVSAFAQVHMHFPSACLQKLLTIDHGTKTLFYSLFRGQTLNQIRLDYCLKRNLSGEKAPLEMLIWFLDIELRRAEHVLDAYSKTIELNPDPTVSPDQTIHRFYHTRLQSDSRFIDFYSENCLDALGVQSPKQGYNTVEFLNAPLTINGMRYESLRYHFDRAKSLLNPGKEGVLANLPVAFGLGDGHGGNVMVNDDPEDSMPRLAYIDYEVSGYHNPFLDMAKSIYNDAFFNVLYADLLSENATKSSVKNNKSGATVSWDVLPDGIDIDYDLQVDNLCRSVAVAKFEYVLLPILEMTKRYDMQKANACLEILSSALLTCALLSRNFEKRPDIFFLNLAVGVRLATELRKVLSEVFGWGSLPMVENLDTSNEVTEDYQLQLLTRDNQWHWESPQMQETLSQDFFAFLFSSDLQPDDVFLKRASETYQLQQRFSQTSKESDGAIIRRISKARRDGMKISPHTCIRESIFAEPRIDHHFVYSRILTECKDDKSRLLVDAGCCMGTDIRKLVFDGFPPENVLGLDIESRYFDVGRTLYNEDLASTKIRFQKADMTDPNFATKYAHLQSRFNFVHSANVIHLFGVSEQEVFFRNLIHLVAPGGTIWGRQVGLSDNFQAGYRQPEGKGARFTINEFRELALRAGNWNESDAEYEAQLVKYDEIRAQRKDKEWVLQWSLKVPAEKEKRSAGKTNSVRIIEDVDS